MKKKKSKKPYVAYDIETISPNFQHWSYMMSIGGGGGGGASENKFSGLDEYLEKARKPKRCVDKAYHIKKLQERIESSKDIISILEKSIEAIKQFNFVEGDVVVIKNKGPAILNGIGLGSDNEALNINESFPNQFYAVVATKDGYEKVPLNEVMPYNAATKILFNK